MSSAPSGREERSFEVNAGDSRYVRHDLSKLAKSIHETWDWGGDEAQQQAFGAVTTVPLDGIADAVEIRVIEGVAEGAVAVEVNEDWIEDHQMDQPPSTRNSAPVTNDASSLARKFTTLATSAGVPTRPSGVESDSR